MGGEWAGSAEPSKPPVDSASFPFPMAQAVDGMLRRTTSNVVRGDAEESKDEHNNLAPSRAAEPDQPSGVGVGGGGNGEDGGNGEEGFGGGERANPTVVQPGRRGDDKEEEDNLFSDTATLSAVERRMNSNTGFYGSKMVNTMIGDTVCRGEADKLQHCFPWLQKCKHEDFSV